MRRLLPLLALLAITGCGDSGGSQTTTGSNEPIVIDSPAPNAAVQSPFHVSGTANTFEATFILELRTEGRLLQKKTVTASSGSGTRGSFDVELRYSLPDETRGELRAYEISADSGEPVNTVSVSISLLP